MASQWLIGPTIGVARLGNSPDEFYLEPDAIGALPIDCDAQGNERRQGSELLRVTRFKDGQGRIKRQAARFRLFRVDEAHPQGQEVSHDSPDVKSIVWSVHLANKKACWFNFAELQGNLLYGADNSYAKQGVGLRNASTTGAARQKLIIDPGPRTVSGPSQKAQFDQASVPAGYTHASFPPPVQFGQQVRTLGELRTDAAGQLLVLGGLGVSGGNDSITSFAGADSWHDDIADGPVTCTVTLATGEVLSLKAWCIVGSPKFVPEIANIVTLDDTMQDVAVRELGANPDLYSNACFNEGYVANFERDVRPILERPGAYRWVANVPSMNSVSPPPFDPRDASAATQPLRLAYLGLFRKPGPQDKVGEQHNQLFSELPGAGGFPMMPLNSGSNSVGNQPHLIDKFLTLTETQYFLLTQWARGRFTLEAPAPENIAMQLTRGSVGNCVGGPFCPGIEVTWSTRNSHLYDAPLSLRHRHDAAWYQANGLSPDEDETAAPLGCEPGDLTKRMAIPWQADFFQCSIQFINFTNPAVNKAAGTGIPAPPTYYAYWWPPQSPWQVLTGDLSVQGQAQAGTPAGYQVMYTRGINTFSQMIAAWHYMGFVVNQVRGEHAGLFPYFTEQERNHEQFVAAAVAVGDASNVVTGADGTFSNSWFMLPPAPSADAASGAATPMAPVRFASSRNQGRRSREEQS